MFLLINKPSGPTSHDIIDHLRRLTHIQKIGHAGTLDPLASGLLIIGLGRASTKRLGQLAKNTSKEYTAVIKLGQSSDTYDQQGQIKNHSAVKPIAQLQIKSSLQILAKRNWQTPPPFSAVKIKGQKAYQLARQGQPVTLAKRKVKVYAWQITNYSWPYLTVTIKTAPGFYVRSLAHDLGQKLGCGALLYQLERTGLGPYRIKQAVQLDQLTPANWRRLAFSLD